MLEKLKSLKDQFLGLNKVYQPLLLRINIPEDRVVFDALFQDEKISFLHDEITTQLKELIKCKNPAKRILEDDYKELINEHIKNKDITEYGVWAYYPWNRKLVHLLDEEEFKEVRTNRNQYKITIQERDLLATKVIGIIGLSVGQSIALTLAMERGFGELRLADFDVLELSNMNRIRTGVSNLGVPKVTIAAREIMEIDPFLKVTCFYDGLTEENITSFFEENGKLDILVDECDGLDMKIIARHKARELKIPVVMDTSDRGMLDVERFDLEPNRPLLHGTANSLDPQNIKELSNEDKIPVILQMLGAENISYRGKASMVEVQQTINTWPQLATSVALGGAVAADVCRRILLNQYTSSGRYYIDLEELVSDKTDNKENRNIAQNPHTPLTVEKMDNIAEAYKTTESDFYIDKHTVTELISAANAAPSTGNDQPWKWLFKNNHLFLFHEESRSFSFGDFKKTASFISFGAAFENLYIKALEKGLAATYEFLPLKNEEKLVTVISFEKLKAIKPEIQSLGRQIFKRHTNRNPSLNHPLPATAIEELKVITQTIPNVSFKYFTEEKQLKMFAKIIGICDRIRLMNPNGHHDFVKREMRWTPEEAETSRDGIDVNTLGLSNAQLAALGMIKDNKVINFLKGIEAGKAFDALANKTLEGASALCLITLPEFNLRNFFEGGRAMERFWLKATQLNIAVHPLISPLYLFSRILQGNGAELDPKDIHELKQLREEFQTITNLDRNHSEVFLAKISIAKEPETKALRLPIENTLFLR
jgi:molybdopterin/thiamine biosynthesis adenylyltransferase